MKKLLPILLALPFGLFGATYTAATCNLTDVQTAINSELATPADGDLIVIPAGTCTWTGTVLVSGNFTHSVTIQGAGALSSNAGGASTTGTDNTIIIDNLNHGGGPSSLINFSAISGKSFRLTGVAIKANGSSTNAPNGILEISGTSSAVRFDHSHIVVTSVDEVGFRVDGSVTGVADHDVFDAPGGSLTNDLGVGQIMRTDHGPIRITSVPGSSFTWKTVSSTMATSAMLTTERDL